MQGIKEMDNDDTRHAKMYLRVRDAIDEMLMRTSTVLFTNRLVIIDMKCKYNIH